MYASSLSPPFNSLYNLLPSSPSPFSTMSDAIGTVILTAMLTRLAKIMEKLVWKQAKLVKGPGKEFRKLKSQFEAIQAVLADAEKRQVEDASKKLWLQNLKGVCCEIQPLLPEWITATQEAEIESQGSQSSPFKKVCSFLTSPCRRCNRAIRRRGIALKIKKINERLCDISIEKERYKFNECTGSKCPGRPKSTSFINVSAVQGRVDEKNDIIKLLCHGNQNEILNIVSIVGVRGIGKTTLAQLVYNSSEVTEHFHRRIWVCAPTPFHEVQVAKAILEDITDEASGLSELETVTRKIRNCVKEEKFLLVLDDVFMDGFRRWEPLFNSLTTGAPGSAILVTTTKESVARDMGSSYQLPLGILPPNDSWCLFEKIAFLGQSTETRRTLEDVGRMIAGKCQGSPFIIKNTGTLMRDKEYTLEEWQHVLQFGIGAPLEQ